MGPFAYFLDCNWILLQNSIIIGILHKQINRIFSDACHANEGLIESFDLICEQLID